MPEHYGLSIAQKEYLSGRKTLANESKEKERMRVKAEKAWSIFEPILRSEVVSQEFKDSLFTFKRFDDFLNSLLRTKMTNPISEELNKMKIAKDMIQKGFRYFKVRYQLQPLIYDEMEKMEKLLIMLEDFVEQELENIKNADFVRLRKGLQEPPTITPTETYHALCIQCYNYNSKIGHNEQDAIQGIEHQPHCSYLKYAEKADHFQLEKINEQFIKIIPPRNK